MLKLSWYNNGERVGNLIRTHAMSYGRAYGIYMACRWHADAIRNGIQAARRCHKKWHKYVIQMYSGMNVRIVYESSTTSNIVGLSVRHNNTRIHVRVRQEVGYRQHGGMILCQ